MKRPLQILAIAAGCTGGALVALAEDSAARRDPLELLRLAFRDGTSVMVQPEAGAAGSHLGEGGENELRVTRIEPVRLRDRKPSHVEFVFVVNHAKPEQRPVDGIVPVLNEKVTRQLELRRDEWSDRARANARREFGNDVRVEFAETLYNDQQEKHLDRLKREGFEVKTDPITVEGETAAMLLLVREHYAERDQRPVTFDATIRFQPQMQDNSNPVLLTVTLGARLDGRINKSVATGSLAELDARHLAQVEQRVMENIEFMLGWFNKDGGRPVSVRRLEEARALREPMVNPLAYPWFGDKGRIVVRFTPPRPTPSGGLGGDDW